MTWKQTKKKCCEEKRKIWKNKTMKGGVWRKGWCFHVIKGRFRGLLCLNLRFLLGGHEGERATLSHGSLTPEWMISGSPPLTPFPFTLLLFGLFQFNIIICTSYYYYWRKLMIIVKRWCSMISDYGSLMFCNMDMNGGQLILHIMRKFEQMKSMFFSLGKEIWVEFN